MKDKSTRAARKPPRAAPESKGMPENFWEIKTLEQLAAEQGVQPIEHLEEVLGQGASLWRDDATFEAFLAGLR